ncbi:hypothetical protein QUF72_15340 [Desulfobacterales bacterium HSG2]|nr:hypothetical protein [Desulfobacterales bacterium HSG2]
MPNPAARIYQSEPSKGNPFRSRRIAKSGGSDLAIQAEREMNPSAPAGLPNPAAPIWQSEPSGETPSAPAGLPNPAARIYQFEPSKGNPFRSRRIAKSGGPDLPIRAEQEQIWGLHFRSRRIAKSGGSDIKPDGICNPVRDVFQTTQAGRDLQSRP